jgi:glycosyltransferase involved in cell wall biosynthesis
MNLLLLTANFPFLPGEHFLENEIGLLAKVFERVSVFPFSWKVGANGLPPRTVPENVDILRVSLPASRYSIGKMGLRTAGLSGGAKDLIAAAAHGGITRPSALGKLCFHYYYSSLFSSLLSNKVHLESYGIVYSYWGEQPGLVLHFLKDRCPQRTVFVARFHGYDLYAEREGLKTLPFQQHVVKACDLAAPCSMQGEDYLRKRYPRSAESIRHSHLGVPAQDMINEGSSDDTLRIATCSSIVPLKRLELLIGALHHVSRKVLWTHIGDGPDKDKINTLSRDLPGNIQTVFSGRMENAMVLDFYCHNPVDLFVNVSSSEGVPVSVMEALSFGIEPVVTEVGGVPELVKPEFGTLLDREFEPGLLAHIIQNHKNSRERRIKAQEHQRNSFSLANYEFFASELLSLSREKNNEN